MLGLIAMVLVGASIASRLLFEDGGRGRTLDRVVLSACAVVAIGHAVILVRLRQPR